LSGRRAVVAPDKFKGALTALEAANAIERGFVRAGWNCTVCPMADGGEGTVQAFIDGGAERKTAHVRGPLGDRVTAAFARNGDLAIVEMAAASGLELIDPQRRDIMHATTFGTGELVRAALDDGARRLIVGVGGSATSDVGTGMLRALGVRFLGEDGRELGDDLAAYEALHAIDARSLDARIAAIRIDVASDVDNPLTGTNGAASMYARQKGATPEQADRLDRIATRIADVTAQTLGTDRRNDPGAGAAGGLGFALMAFLHARLQHGAELIARERGLPDRLRVADLCATGEGRIDVQTLHGKTVAGVAALAREANVPVVAFAGKVEEDARAALAQHGIDSVQTAPAEMQKEEAMRRAGELLEVAAYVYAVDRR
jgi:glycerate kinase